MSDVKMADDSDQMPYSMLINHQRNCEQKGFAYYDVTRVDTYQDSLCMVKHHQIVSNEVIKIKTLINNKKIPTRNILIMC